MHLAAGSQTESYCTLVVTIPCHILPVAALSLAVILFVEMIFIKLATVFIASITEQPIYVS